MSYNGSGSFSINTAGQPVVNATTINATVFNDFTADVATGLTTAICKDGQTVITANLPMSGFKHTGVADGTARNHYASLANVQDGTGVYVATVGGTADVITLTPAPAITAYAAGQTFRFLASGANTTNVTVAVSGLAAKAITKAGATALIAGDLPSGSMVEMTYDGTRFILTSAQANISAFMQTVLDDTTATAARTTLAALGSAENAVGVAAGAITGAMLNDSVVNDLTTVTIATGDYVALADVSDTNKKKKALVSDIMALASTIPPQGHIYGMTLSNGTDAVNDINVAAGSCASTHATPSSVVLLNPGAIVKQLDATWAAGTNAGGRSSSVALSNTTYHVFAIRVAGVDDVGFDTSATGANLVTDHSATHIRRIGSVLRESASLVAFAQNRNEFLRKASVLDYNTANPGTSAITVTLSVPIGIQVRALLKPALQSSLNAYVLYTSLDQNDEVPSGTVAPLANGIGANIGTAIWPTPCEILTNTSGQIRFRLSASEAASQGRIATYGWIDMREQ